MAYISKYDIESLKNLRDSVDNKKYNYFYVTLDKIVSNVERERLKQNNRMKIYERKKRSV